jgi:hypothetical protein
MLISGCQIILHIKGILIRLMSYLFPLNNSVHGSNPDVLDKEDGQGNIIAGAWRNDNVSWQDFHPQCSNNYSNEARLIREEFKEYFNNEGAVTWQ